MKRRVELALCLLAGGAFGQTSVEDAIQQEWRIRTLALDSRPMELAESESWPEQVADLEALRRRLSLGRGERVDESVLARLQESLGASVANVRATALACLALTEEVTWDAATIERLARDPLPEVRSRLCRAVPARVWSEHVKVLAELARADDEEVRRAARTKLYELEAAETQAELLTDVLRAEGPAAYLNEAEHWVRATRKPMPTGDAAQVFESFDAAGRSLRAAKALWLATAGKALDRDAADTLVAGWLDPLDPSWGRKHRAQNRLLHEAARKSGLPVAEALVTALAEASRVKTSLALDDAREDYLEGLFEAASSEFILARLVQLELGDSDLASFWLLARLEDVDWSAGAIKACLALERSIDLRVQTADAIAGALARTGDLSARDQLVRLLTDREAEVRQIAFEALCDAPLELLGNLEQPLFEAWRSQPEDDRLASLTQLPRVRPLQAFRASLLSRGEDLRSRRGHPSILELLGKLDGDDVSDRLRVWLEHDVAGLLREESSQERRLAEIAARGGVRALHSVAGEEAVDSLHEVLRLTATASTDVAKVAAWSLGQSEAGRSCLPQFLDETLPTRIQVEAAIALTLHSAEVEKSDLNRATRVLLDRFASCDSELRRRILAAFAMSGSAPGQQMALDLASNPNTDSGMAAQALAVVVAGFEADPTDARYSLIESCFDTAQSVETRLVAMDALLQTRHSRVPTVFEERLDAEPVPSEREGLLIALSQCAPKSEVLWSALWVAPMESARARLAKRFRGESTAAIAFSYRGEITALESLVGAGGWRLDAEPDLSRLDGRLALELGEACRKVGYEQLASRFDRIALVALEGEFPDEQARFAVLQAQVRLWRSAENASRHQEAAFFASALHSGWVEGSVSDRDLEALIGAYDPARGVDPVARLATSNLQSRARLAASEGDRARAAELLREARARLGFSEAALKEQESAERDLR